MSLANLTKKWNQIPIWVCCVVVFTVGVPVGILVA